MNVFNEVSDSVYNNPNKTSNNTTKNMNQILQEMTNIHNNESDPTTENKIPLSDNFKFLQHSTNSNISLNNLNQKKEEKNKGNRVIPNFQMTEGIVNPNNSNLMKYSLEKNKVEENSNEKTINSLKEQIKILENKLSIENKQSEENSKKISIIENKLETGFSKLNNILQRLTSKLN